MMPGEQPPLGALEFQEASGFTWDADGEDSPRGEVLLRPPASYRQALGDAPIRVGVIEFHIMLFLASRPYHAFTCREIAWAVSSRGQSLAEEAVDQYVAALRDQLGVFHDYVQTVPHVGYRFKP